MAVQDAVGKRLAAGIIESVNEYGEEFGEQRVVDILERNRHLSAEVIQNILVERVLEWSFEEERDDDMTLIVAKMIDVVEPPPSI